jgi:hypothetical protein
MVRRAYHLIVILSFYSDLSVRQQADGIGTLPPRERGRLSRLRRAITLSLS